MTLLSYQLMATDIPFETIKFPFPYRGINPFETQFVADGTYAFIKDGSPVKYLFAGPFSPCVAIVVWDSEKKDAFFSHNDGADLNHLATLLKKYFAHSEKSHLHAFLYTTDQVFFDDYKYLKIHGIESPKVLLSAMKMLLKQTLQFEDDHISAQLHSLKKNPESLGEYGSAMLSLGFDLRTFEFFTCALFAEMQKKSRNLHDLVSMAEGAALSLHIRFTSLLIEESWRKNGLFAMTNIGKKLPFLPAYSFEDLSAVAPENDPARRLLARYKDLMSPESRSLILSNKIAFEDMKFPFPWQEWQGDKTKMIYQGECAACSFNDEKDKLFTTPCSPCPAVLIYDEVLKKAWLAHPDPHVDFHSIVDNYHKEFFASAKENIRVVIFSSLHNLTKIDDLKEKYGVKTLPDLLRKLKNFIEKELKLPRAQIRAYLWHIENNIQDFDWYAMAQQGLGFDTNTMSLFSSAVVESPDSDESLAWSTSFVAAAKMRHPKLRMHHITDDKKPLVYGAYPLFEAAE